MGSQATSHPPLTLHEALPQAGRWAALGQPLASKHREASQVSSLEHRDTYTHSWNRRALQCAGTRAKGMGTEPGA